MNADAVVIIIISSQVMVLFKKKIYVSVRTLKVVLTLKLLILAHFSTRNINRSSADILCGRPPDLWPLELKIDTPVTPDLGNIYTKLVTVLFFFV